MKLQKLEIEIEIRNISTDTTSGCHGEQWCHSGFLMEVSDNTDNAVVRSDDGARTMC